jgi:hypothetical protein
MAWLPALLGRAQLADLAAATLEPSHVGSGGNHQWPCVHGSEASGDRA